MSLLRKIEATIFNIAGVKINPATEEGLTAIDDGLTAIADAQAEVLPSGELPTASKHAEINVSFQYGLNDQKTRTSIVASGTATTSNGNAVASSGAAASSSALIESYDVLTSKVGQTWMVDIPFYLVDAPIAGNDRFIGWGEKGVDGFFIGSQGNQTGILHYNNTVATFINSSAFLNVGSTELPTLDFEKGNAFRIIGQHGYGVTDVYVKSGITGKYVLLHRFNFANSLTAPSLRNPSNPIIMYSENTTNTTNVAIASDGFAGFIIGDDQDRGVIHLISTTYSGNPSDENILTIRGKSTLGGINNKVTAKPLRFTLAVDGTKVSNVRLVVNGTLTGTPVWTDVDAVNSSLEYDTAGIYTAGTGEPRDALDLAKVDSAKDNVAELSIELRPQDTVSVIWDSAATLDANVSVLMNEEI